MTGPSFRERHVKPSIVFHHPMPVAEVAISGSQVRPVQMISAFRSIGYRVDVVAGSGFMRSRSIEEVVRRVERGHSYRFLYSESATPPTALTDSHNLPLRPAMDFRFMRQMRRSGAPVGLYYRDIHWRFPHYQQVAWYKRAIAIPFYYYDWWQYRRSVDWLFLPSQRMYDALPGSWPKERAVALPPGCVVRDDVSRPPRDYGSQLRIFYVGGITPPLYDLTQLLEVVRITKDLELILCCRPLEFEEWASYYSLEGESHHVRIVHASGDELQEHFASADVFALVWEVGDYQEFAMPVKVMEAIGYGLPIVTMAGTEVGRFVAEHEIGWVVDGPEDLRNCLTRLRENRVLVARAAEQVRRIRRAETWEARARRVAEILDPACRGAVLDSRPATSRSGSPPPPRGGRKGARIALLGPGNNVHVEKWANALARRGYDVHLFSQHEFAGSYVEAVQTHCFPGDGWIGYYANVPRLRWYLARIAPDLLHCHYASGYGTLARLSGFSPRIISVWGSDVFEFPQRSWLHARVLRKNLTGADRICSTSYVMADRVRQLVSESLPVEITPFGVDIETFVPSEARLREDDIVVGTVKHLSYVYGIDVLLRAFAETLERLRTVRPDLVRRLRLVVVGGGPDEVELRALARDLAIEEVTEFRGRLQHREVPETLRGFDVFVAPSRFESFGVSVLEASATGLPVVAARVGGLTEIIEDRETGILVRPEDPASMAEALTKLVLNPELARKLGSTGRLRVEEKYSWEASVDIMEAVYARVLESVAPQ